MNSLAKSLIVRCAELGITEWVICPGARNVDLLAILAQAQGVRLWTHFDERAAGFFALGRIQATGMPVAVLTTSGTAVAELLPAVIEAHYQGRPLVIISADREAIYRGSGAPQAIEQVNIFSDYVNQCVDIEEEVHLEKLAHGALGWDFASPIHFNICLPEPNLNQPIVALDIEPATELPYPPFKEDVGKLVRFLRDDCWKGLVVLLGGLEPADQDPILWLLEQLGAPVLADATSGLREALGDLALSDGDNLLKQYPPACVLRIGDIPTGRFWRDLEDLPDIMVYSLTRTGYSGLAKRPSVVIRGTMERIIRAMGDVHHVGDMQDLLVRSRKRAGIIEELLVAYGESEQALMYSLSLFASLSDLVYLGNSMPVREWNIFAQRMVETTNVRANRGANGIDGQLSTFLGAAADVSTAWGIFGDITALYDANAGAQAIQLPEGRRIIAIINNQGGRIFETLPGGAEMNKELEKLLVQPHAWTMKPMADLWNAHYKAVYTVDDLDFTPEEGLTFLEIYPSKEQTDAVWRQYKR